MIAVSHVGVPLLPNWFVMQQSPGWSRPFVEFCLTYFNPVWSVFGILVLVMQLPLFMHSNKPIFHRALVPI